MKNDLALQVGKEVRAAVAIQTDQIMTGIESIPAIKTNTELCVSNIADNGQFLGEVAQSMSHSESNFEKKMDIVVTAIRNTKDTVEQTLKSVNNSSAQLSEVVKVDILLDNHIFIIALGFTFSSFSLFLYPSLLFCS